MAPLTGVTQLQGDITKLETAEKIIQHFGNDKKAQLVIELLDEQLNEHCAYFIVGDL